MSQVTIFFPRLAVVLIISAVTFGLAGCYTPGPERVSYRASAPAPVPPIIEQDDYMYYPGYEVYYNNTRHQYVYRDGQSWVNRPQPPQAWAQALSGSPSVHVDFHDAPARHHDEVVKTYPRNWRPEATKRPQESDNHRVDHRDDQKDDKHRDN